MSAISLKSITGITSITTPAGVDNQLTLHNNNTTEAVKLDVAGNLHVNNQISVTGIITASQGLKINVSPAITIRDGTTEKGYIGFYANDPFIGRKNGVGLAFQNNKVRPVDGDDGSPSNNTIDLGEPTYRFKDGYFAGSLDIEGDIDVNGHTNLDNVSIAGITTSSQYFNSVSGLRVANHPVVGYVGFTAISGGSYATTLGSTGTTTLRHTQIYGGGSVLATFDGVNNRVGIGSVIPSRTLDVVGNIRASVLYLDRHGSPTINMVSTSDTGGGAIYFGSPASGIRGGILYNHDGDVLKLRNIYGTSIEINNARKSTFYGDIQISKSASYDPHANLTIQTHATAQAEARLYFKARDNSNNEETSYIEASSDNTANVDLKFAVNNSEKLRITSAGKVGINKTPDAAGGLVQLRYNEVFTSGTTNLLTSSSKAVFRLQTSSNSSKSLFFGGIDESATPYLQVGNMSTSSGGATATYPLIFQPYGGNIGINETNPQQLLHIHCDTNYQGILINGNSAPRIAFARSTTTTGEWSVGIDGTNGNNFCINRSNDNSNRLFVIGNGQTNSNQNTAITGILYNNEIVSITSTNDDSTSHVSISARNAAAGYGNYFIVGVSGNTYFGAGANNYSSNPSGNNINGGTTIRVYGGISSNAYNDAHRFGRNTDGSIVIFQSAGGTEGSIAISGSTTNYNTSSDYRLKENIVYITDGITRLKQLKPRRFNFIKDPSITKDGFIAHEVDSIVPEAVTGTKDETFSKDDEDNNVKAGDPKYQHMDASKLIPLLTAALKEAVAKIETLETKVAALESS